jgi:hypothetical protein
VKVIQTFHLIKVEWFQWNSSNNDFMNEFEFRKEILEWDKIGVSNQSA